MRVGFVGAGHIAGALSRGWLRPGVASVPDLRYFDLDHERAIALAVESGGETVVDLSALVVASDLIIVAVRPPQVTGVLDALAPLLGECALVSVAAGVPLRLVQAHLAPGARCGRLMPNTAAEVGQGVFLFVPGSLGSSEAADVRGLFEAEGVVVEIHEALFDAATAVAGCGPGFAALAIEGVASGGVGAGLESEDALRLAAAAFRGAAALVEAEGLAGPVWQAVAVPGGMTAAGIEVLQQASMPAAFERAVLAAAARALELA
jgi:pyrroline-5-carboxylate reductase